MHSLLFSLFIVSSPTLAVDYDTKDVTLCVKTETDFVDVAWGGGDYWTSNSVRRLRGVHVRFTDVTGTWWEFMDDDGCKVVEITVDRDSSEDYFVYVESNSEMGSYKVFSYWESSDGSSYGFAWEADLFDIDNSSPLLVIPDSDVDIRVWQNLALGVYALYRSSTNYYIAGHGNTAGCPDSSIPCCGQDAWELSDESSMPEKEINFVSKPVGTYSSTWDSPDSHPDYFGSEVPGVKVYDGGSANYGKHKHKIAHELGHVVMWLRVGDDDVAKDNDAEEFGCMGSWQDEAMNDPANNKGLITREYEAIAIWEGWADFFSAWLWNDDSEAGCEYKNNNFHDFDLDGDLDNNYVLNTFDGVFSCEGAGLDPDFSEPLPMDPLEEYVTAKDWLQDMYDDASACPDESGTYTTGYNTKYDYLRYFWDMASDQGVSIEKLGTVLVDMCPATWEGTTGGEPQDDWPTERLERSISFHDLEDEHDAEKANYDHSN